MSKPTRGFFTFAQGTEYQRLAYALALSLKISQKDFGHLSIGVDEDDIDCLPKKYLEVFDHIVPIPWGDDSSEDDWKRKNEWKAIHMSPYDETIKLDCDMLFTTDISEWWSLLTNFNMLFVDKPLTYRNEPITSDYYRKCFTTNSLPNIYTAFQFFKKKPECYAFARMAAYVFNNWESFYDRIREPNTRPRFVSADVVYAIVSKLLGNEDSIVTSSAFPTFVHMKPQLQNWGNIPDVPWLDVVNGYVNESFELYIGNFKQTMPIHYVDKKFVTNNMIKNMEKTLGI